MRPLLAHEILALVNRLLTLALLAAIAGLGLKFVWRYPRGAVKGPPVVVTDEPTQVERDVPTKRLVSRSGNVFEIIGTHDYEVKGEVISAMEYSFAWKSDFFDVDVGLIWGPNIKEMKERYTFRQNGRFLFWGAKGPVSDEERAFITTHIGNEHLIPKEGSTRIDNAIRWVRAGDRVRIKGQLVVVKDVNSGKDVARSSTTRDDVGPGACEIVYVEEIQINGDVYR